MGLKEERQAAKERLIINSLEHPMTCQELAGKLEISYYTLKPILNDMVKRGLIQDSGFRKGGALQYMRLTESALPMLQHFKSKAWVTPIQIMDVAIKQGLTKNTSAAEACNKLAPAMWAIIGIAVRVERGLSGQADIDALKHNIADLYKEVESIASFYEQVLNNNEIWSEAGMRKIASSPDFPADSELTAYGEKFGS